MSNLICNIIISVNIIITIGYVDDGLYVYIYILEAVGWQQRGLSSHQKGFRQSSQMGQNSVLTWCTFPSASKTKTLRLWPQEPGEVTAHTQMNRFMLKQKWTCFGSYQVWYEEVKSKLVPNLKKNLLWHHGILNIFHHNLLRNWDPKKGSTSDTLPRAIGTVGLFPRSRVHPDTDTNKRLWEQCGDIRLAGERWEHKFSICDLPCSSDRGFTWISHPYESDT